MTKEEINEYKERCRVFLNTCGIASLRVYGQTVGVPRSTALKKEALIEEIIAIICGEKQPKTRTVGAPLKNTHTTLDIVDQLVQLENDYKAEKAELQKKEQMENEPPEPVLPSNQIEKIDGMQLVISFSDLNDDQKEKLGAFFQSLAKSLKNNKKSRL